MKLKLNYAQMLTIYRSNKDFILFDYCKQTNKLTGYKLTNDLIRYKNNFNSFRVLSCIKKELSNKTINI